MSSAGPLLPHLPNTLELSGRIVLAALLAGLIGLEREVNEHPSGLRTHIAVAVGSALFGICSAYAFREFVAVRADNNYQLDPTRIAAQIVTGVGFLGAGAIVKQGNTVRGLTSAAGLWVSAAVGLAVSVGMYIEASVATLTLLVALVLLRAPRRWLRRKLQHVNETVIIAIPLDVDPSGVLAHLISAPDVNVHSLVVKRHEHENFTTVEVEVGARSGVLQNRLAEIEGRSDVLSVETG